MDRSRIVLTSPPVFDQRSHSRRRLALMLVRPRPQREREEHWFALASGLLVGIVLGFSLAICVLP